MTIKTKKLALLHAIIAGMAAAWFAVLAVADEIPAGWTAQNVRPIGYVKTEESGGGKMTLIRRGERWFLYNALRDRGLGIIDVTDAANPKLLSVVPEARGQVTANGNLLITGVGGQQINLPGEGVSLWDITVPDKPKLQSHWSTGAYGTHRNYYPGGKYAYLSAGLPGFKGVNKRQLVLLDVSDPKKPFVATVWWLPGHKDGEVFSDPAIETSQAYGHHGAMFASGEPTTLYDEHSPRNIATIGYAPYIVNLDIRDKNDLREIGKLRISPPFLAFGNQTVHTVVPLSESLVFASSEAHMAGCKEDELNFAGLIDNREPREPKLLSLLPVPMPPKDAPYKSFCDKGGRFGPHNTNSEIFNPDVQKPGDLLYLTYFNAGLRVFDIRDPRHPVESGWFVPPNPAEARRSQVGTLKVNQTQDVLVDARGNIFVTDSAWGVWVLRYAE